MDLREPSTFRSAAHGRQRCAGAPVRSRRRYCRVMSGRYRSSQPAILSPAPGSPRRCAVSASTRRRMPRSVNERFFWTGSDESRAHPARNLNKGPCRAAGVHGWIDNRVPTGSGLWGDGRSTEQRLTGTRHSGLPDRRRRAWGQGRAIPARTEPLPLTRRPGARGADELRPLAPALGRPAVVPLVERSAPDE
jgi:hypothetical protein